MSKSLNLSHSRTSRHIYSVLLTILCVIRRQLCDLIHLKYHCIVQGESSDSSGALCNEATAVAQMAETHLCTYQHKTSPVLLPLLVALFLSKIKHKACISFFEQMFVSYCKAYSFYLLSFKDPVNKDRGYYLVIVVYNQTKYFSNRCLSPPRTLDDCTAFIQKNIFPHLFFFDRRWFLCALIFL